MPASALPKRLTDLGAAIFVPALAQLNDQGAIIRREALWTGFDEEQQELLGRFERWRLVVRKGEGAESIVEVAHEALFREWTRLKHWLEPERARLDALRLLQIDAANWVRNAQNTAFLNHRGKRLREADALAANDNYRKRLGDKVAYLIACHGLERAARRRVYAVAALVGVLSLALAGGVTAWSQGPWLKRQAYWVVHARALSAGQERELQPGDPPFRECSRCPAMVVLRANSFTMGSTAKAQERPPAPGHHRAAVRGWSVRGDVRRMGRLRRPRRRVRCRRRHGRLGAWPPAGDLRQLARGTALRPVAVAGDWPALSNILSGARSK